MNINEMARSIHKQNVEIGWWDDPRPFNELLMLVVSEISEAMEGVRKDLMDDKLPHRKMEEVELADAKIRLLDMAGFYGWEYSELTARIIGSVDPKRSPAEHLFHAVSMVTLMRGELDEGGYSLAVREIDIIAAHRGYDLDGALLEKIEYNKHRADHKRENRAKEGGKKF